MSCDLQVEIGDVVMLCPDEPNEPLYISKIMYMWEESGGKKFFHGRWFRSGFKWQGVRNIDRERSEVELKESYLTSLLLCSRSTDTVLGETGDPRELFTTEECDDNPLGAILDQATVASMTIA